LKKGCIITIIIIIFIPIITVIAIVSIQNKHNALKVIEGILDSSLTIGYEYISTDVVQLPISGRGKTVYTFKDENDVYFNVYYSNVRHYDSYFTPERLYICNYHEIIFSDYLEEIENAFLEHLSPDEFSLVIGDSARIRSDRVGRLYDFRFYEYVIDIIHDSDIDSAKDRIIAAVEAAINAAPNWQQITKAHYTFDYSRYPYIRFYYHGAFMGRAHFIPDYATYFDVADGEAAIYFIDDWAFERNLREKGLIP